MGVVIDLMQITSVRRIIENAEMQIEAETGASVKLAVLINKSELVDLPFVVQLTCSLTGIKKEVLLSQTRNRNVVEARKIIALLARTYLKLSWQEIGNALGERCHGTVIHLVGSALNHLEMEDHMFVPKYKAIHEAFLNHLQRINDEGKVNT